MRTLWCFSSEGKMPRIIRTPNSMVGSATLTT